MTRKAPMEPPNPVTPVSTDDPTIGRLVTDASRDISSLIKNEIALAKSELKISVRAGGTGIGLFGAALRSGSEAIMSGCLSRGQGEAAPTTVVVDAASF